MRLKRKIALAVLAAAASALGGSEIAKKRFSQGKGESYWRFLDRVIRFKDEAFEMLHREDAEEDVPGKDREDIDEVKSEAAQEVKPEDVQDVKSEGNQEL